MTRKIKSNPCPICGKCEISRTPPPLDAGILDVGGWQIRCSICRSLVWIPLDETKPIEAVVIPVFGFPAFESDEIKLPEQQ